jgi:tetratricopeptide (TPR) repeat protein
MKHLGWIAAVLLIGCGGSGPSQAEGPKPTLPSGPEENQTASGAGGEALEAAKAGDFKAAKEKADAALAKNPKDAIAHYARGIAAEDGDKDDATAEKHYRAALEANPKLVGASIFLSAQMIKLKRFDEAAKVAREGLVHDKGTYELHLHLGIALHESGDHANAAKSFANAAKLHDDANTQMTLAQELLEVGDKDGASRAFKNAVAKANGDAKVIKEAAIGLKEAGDFVSCASSLEPILAKQANAMLYEFSASCRHSAKDLAGARKDLAEAIKLQKPPSWKMYFVAGKWAEEAGDKKECRAQFLEAGKLIVADKVGTKAEEEAKKGADRCK